MCGNAGHFIMECQLILMGLHLKLITNIGQLEILARPFDRTERDRS